MAYITGLRRNKTEYTPEFIKAIDEETCIGCARCYKVCATGCWPLKRWMRTILPRCT